ncbi:molybdopterin-binding protein, partial [Dehalococcoidia bacterium]|nr:molybdopterin-binding protein [Dehalococcoidia bacterium]
MYAEIIASGTELLMGETQDTNSGYLASQLPSLGLELRQISLVGDDLNDYTEVLDRAWLRANFTFTTGGLGPTNDDVTREAIAQVLQEDIYIDNEQLDVLKSMFKSRGTEMPLRNIKQAGLIPSAYSIPNPLGTAPGWWVEKGNQVIIALPGPPRELEAMWTNEVAPRLKNRIKGSVVLTKTLKTTGLSEARVDEMAAPVLDNINPYVGVYAKPDGIHLRIISKASNEKEAVRLLNTVDKKLQVIFSTSIWGIDSDAAEDMVGKLLTKGNMTLATMESCTGGMLADTITNVSGSSNYYQGGFV